LCRWLLLIFRIGCARVEQREETKNINLQVYTKIGKVKTLSISGDYSPTNHQIAFEINLNRLKLNILQPYLTGIVSDLKGEVNGNFSIVGTTEKPLIEGTLDILDTYFILDFSKVRYNIKNSITITNNEFKFEDFNIFDPNWKMLVLNGNIMHNNFENIRRMMHLCFLIPRNQIMNLFMEQHI